MANHKETVYIIYIILHEKFAFEMALIGVSN